MHAKATVAPETTAPLDFWAKLAELFGVYQSAPGAMRLNTERPPIRLEAMLRLTESAERDRLLVVHGWSLSAWRKWCARPANLPGPVLTDVITYWQQRSGQSIAAADVWLPLNA